MPRPPRATRPPGPGRATANDGSNQGEAVNDQALAEHVGSDHHAAPDAARVLLVLPAPRLRQALATVLRMRGMAVAEADNADRALAVARAWHPTVVVLEPRLPEVGIRVIGKLHQIDPRLRVLAYTHPTTNISQVLDDAGAYRAILKGDGAIQALVEAIPGAHDAYRIDASVRVLLVSPSPEARASMVELFREHGMAVIPAAEGRAAIALAQDEQPTVAAIDLATGSGEEGGVRGIQVASRLLDLTPAPRVVFLSAVARCRDDAIQLNFRVFPAVRKGAFPELLGQVRAEQAAYLGIDHGDRGG